jgi:hypothetical protein
LASPKIERRQFQRVTLIRPIPARVGGSARVFVIDASLNGLRIAHQGTVSAPGQPCMVTFEWEGRKVELDCQIIRNEIFKKAKSALDKNVYHAGIRIVSAMGDSSQVLRELIADHVARALDEQKANARGIPATAAQSFQTGKGTEYVRYELMGTKWRRTPTTTPNQPANGFTISAEEPSEHGEMLCDTWVSSDAAGRRLIQTMAELSISKAEGIPTRRYMP